MRPKQKLVTQYNFMQERYGVGEVNVLPSKTVPDMVLPLRTLIERFTRGQQVQQFNPVYLGEDTLVPADLERMDPVDRLIYAQQLRAEIESARKKNYQLQEQQKQKLFNKKIQTRVEDAEVIEPPKPIEPPHGR